MKSSNPSLNSSRRAALFLMTSLVIALGASPVFAQTIINVGGVGTIGDSTLTTSGGVATLPANGDTWKANGGNGGGTATYSYLQSPSITVSNSGVVTLTFTHRWNFEVGFDGGAVYVNTNGAGFNKVLLSDFTSNGYNTNVTSTAWAAEDIFGGQSAGWSTPALITSVASLGSLTSGDTVQVEFRGGWDENTFPAAPNWEIGTVQVADTGATLLNADFNANGRSGFTASTTGSGASPWNYLTPTFRFEINGDTLTADRFAPSSVPAVIDLNNSKIQVVLLTGTLDIGDTFSLFNLTGGSTLSNSIASISLPGGVAWNTSNVGTNGTISVSAITAANGTWISDSGGNWSDATKWSNGIVADYVGRTANFVTNITAARTVTNDTYRIIGNITFTDGITSSHDLTIFGASGNNLELNATTNKPVINVTQSGRQLTINCVVSGTNGYRKDGVGVLNMTGANNYTGTTIANGGILNFASGNMDLIGGGSASRDISVTASTPTNAVQRSFAVLNNAFLNRLVESTNEFGIFHNATGANGFTTNDLDFSSSTGANLPNAFLGTWAGNGAQCRYDGLITPASDNYRLGFPTHSGTMHITRDHGDVGGTPRGLIIGGGSVNLTGENTFTGDTVLRFGRLFLGRNLAIQNSALNVGTGTDGIAGQLCFLASNAGGSATNATLTDQPTFGGLIGSRNLATVYNNANANNTTRLAPTAVVGLVLNVASNKTCTYSGNVKIAAGMYLTKTGLGTQVLSGNNDYSGATTVSAGTLTMSGYLTNNTASVTVADGATLNLSGHGATPAIISPGYLALGTSGATTLGFSGLTSTNVAVVNVDTLMVDSTVTINITGGLSIGQLPLIKYTTAMSGAGSFVLGSLPANVIATLVTNGPNQSIDLQVTGAPVSIITDLATNTVYRFVGGTYSQTVVAGGTPTLNYAWTRNGTPVGVNSATLSLSNLLLGDSGGYSVLVSNSVTSAKSKTNNLVVVQPSSYDSLVIASNPVAFWPLNEASGPVVNDYTASYNGTYGSAGVTYNVNGPVGNKVVTLATNASITIPYASALNPSSFSVELWTKPALVPYNLSNIAYIASSVVVASPRSGWYLVQDDGNGSTFGNGSAFIVRLFAQNGTTESITLAAPLTNSSWNHLVLTYDANSTEASLYQNGVLASNGFAAFVPNVSAPLTVGMRSDAATTTRFQGSVGGVALYNRVLSTNEIAAHAVLPPSSPAATLLTNSVSGGILSLSWPAGQGWRLQEQTNGLSKGLSTNWVYVTDSSVSSTNITLNTINPTTFYRLVYP